MVLEESISFIVAILGLLMPASSILRSIEKNVLILPH